VPLPGLPADERQRLFADRDDAVRGFRVTAGEPVRGGIKGPELEHYFCPHCMTWVFTRIVGMNDFVNVRPTMFDDPRWSRPFIETMTSAKLPWAETPAKHSYEGFPPVEDYGRLMAEFATEG
jgi:hypothetical protein